MALEIPEVVIGRLPIYARALANLALQGRDVVSSQDLGAQLGITPAQIRKDLSYFGRFGKQGRGYNVRKLVNELQRILGLDRHWTMVLVGAGKLGRAILGYDGFSRQGFHIVAAFDHDASVVGQTVSGVAIRNVDELEKYLAENQVDVGIVAVPAANAQDVITTLIGCGIKAILNYAPIEVQVPAGVHISNIDPVLALQSMTYYLKANQAIASK